MAITYSYNIGTFDVYSQKDDKTDVIYNVHFTYCGQTQEEEDNPESRVYNSYYNGMISLDQPNDEFTEIDDVTKEQVISWIESKVNIEEIQTNIINDINEQMNPTIKHINPNF